VDRTVGGDHAVEIAPEVVTRRISWLLRSATVVMTPVAFGRVPAQLVQA
jgi:hypothetical protein